MDNSTPSDVEEDDFGLNEYDEDQPWDMTDGSDNEEGVDQHNGHGGGGSGGGAAAQFQSYTDVVENLNILQVPNVSFSTLMHALSVVFDHFNGLNTDRSLYVTMVEKLGCICREEDDTFVVSTVDGKYAAKDAIQYGLHVFAETIGVLHMCFLKCNDIEASTHQDLTFDSEEVNVKLAELYYRHSAFTQRLMVEFDIVHPMASSSRVLLNKAKQIYQEHAAFHRFLNGIGDKGGRSSYQADTMFMIYFTIYQLNVRGYRVRGNTVYKQVKVPKRKPIAQGVDEEGFPVYKCCHKDELGQECGVLRTKHKHPIEHMWLPKFEVSATETWDTHYWKPIGHRDFYNLDEPSIRNFVLRVGQEHGKAAEILMGNNKVAMDVETYIVKSFPRMIKYLETKERTYACWNGILISSVFYPYDEIPKEYDSLTVNKFFPKWYFHEEDDRAMRGKPCDALLPMDYFREYPRPPKFRYDGYVQNLYCTMCRRPHDEVNHSKCGYHAPRAPLCLRRPGYDGSSMSSSSASAIPAKWTLRCTECKQEPGQCKCEGGVPTVYRMGSMRYLRIPTIHWDQLVMTQIRGMTITSPTEKGVRIPLPATEHMNTYRWVTGLSFRPNFRIGPHAKAFKVSSDTQVEQAHAGNENEDEDVEEKSVYADCWRVAVVFKGETNTGKTASNDMAKVYLPDFGNLSDANMGKFMLEQCIDSRHKFKPILMGEMGPNTLGRTHFCALVDANTVIPVCRKGIPDVNAICDRGMTLLCNKFRLAGGDVEGSVKSRLAMVTYEVTVDQKDVDGMIHNRNANDPIPLVRKGNWAYEDISSKHGHEHFARVCPMVYLENRARFEAEANPLRQFLNEPISEKLGPLVIDKDVYMRRKDLIEAYRDHCKLNGILKVAAWNDDHYDLRRSKIRPAPLGSIYDAEGTAIMEKFVYGIAPVSDPTTAQILAAKANNPVGGEELEDDFDDLDDQVAEAEAGTGTAADTCALSKDVIKAMDHLTGLLQRLTMRDDASREDVAIMFEKMRAIDAHMVMMERTDILSQKKTAETSLHSSSSMGGFEYAEEEEEEEVEDDDDDDEGGGRGGTGYVEDEDEESVDVDDMVALADAGY